MASPAGRHQGQMHRDHQEGGGDGAPGRLQDEAAARGQVTEIVGQAECAQQPDRGRERGARAIPEQGGRHQEPDGDRQAAAAGRRNDV